MTRRSPLSQAAKQLADEIEAKRRAKAYARIARLKPKKRGDLAVSFH